MKVKILDTVYMGCRGFAPDTEVDIPVEIASTWISKGFARVIGDTINKVAQPVEDNEPGEYDIDKRTEVLIDDYTLDQLKDLHEQVVGTRPHWKAKAETIAREIAAAEIAGA